MAAPRLGEHNLDTTADSFRDLRGGAPYDALLIMKSPQHMKAIAALILSVASSVAAAQGCHQTSIVAPSPFMGNHSEVFKTAEGTLYQVSGSYEYMYEYYPTATICPSQGRMQVAGKIINIIQIQGGPSAGSRGPSAPASRKAAAPIEVVLRVRGCDYFVADGPRGYYVLEWYGGYDPDKGDGMFGDLGGYGMKDVMYAGGQSGRIWVEDYLLSKDSVLNKIREKCS
jgi:hypothetical protein